MTTRRKFTAGVAAAAVFGPRGASAQSRVVSTIGFLLAGTAATQERNLRSFREGMGQLGYEEGITIHYGYRFADGFLDRLPDLAVDLLRLNPSIIVTAPLSPSLAAQRATRTIPIVMATGADPVRFGLVTSLSHPGVT